MDDRVTAGGNLRTMAGAGATTRPRRRERLLSIGKLDLRLSLFETHAPGPCLVRRTTLVPVDHPYPGSSLADDDNPCSTCGIGACPWLSKRPRLKPQPKTKPTPWTQRDRMPSDLMPG